MPNYKITRAWDAIAFLSVTVQADSPEDAMEVAAGTRFLRENVLWTLEGINHTEVLLSARVEVVDGAGVAVWAKDGNWEIEEDFGKPVSVSLSGGERAALAGILRAAAAGMPRDMDTAPSGDLVMLERVIAAVVAA